MSVEENMRVVDAKDEAINARDWDRFDEIFAESSVYTTADLPEALKGVEAIRQRFMGLVSAFPDGKVEKERSFGQGDSVFLGAYWSGTHDGPLPGPGGQVIPATGKSVRVPLGIMFEVEGGKITETREYWDVLGMLTQLGVTTQE
ncbi:MAG: ester cyclase [Thermoplasmata archaeon]